MPVQRKFHKSAVTSYSNQFSPSEQFLTINLLYGRLAV